MKKGGCGHLYEDSQCIGVSVHKARAYGIVQELSHDMSVGLCRIERGWCSLFWSHVYLYPKASLGHLEVKKRQSQIKGLLL